MVSIERFTTIRPRSDFGTATGFLGNERAMRDSKRAMLDDLDMCLAAASASESAGVGGALTTHVTATLTEARADLESVWSDIADCHGPGEPFELWDVALAWADVADLLKGQAVLFDQSRFPATDTWSSPQSEVYRALPEHQRQVTEQVAAAVTAVSDALTSHAATVIAVWLDMFDQLASFGLQLSDDACRFLAADPVEWPGLAQGMTTQIRHAQASVQEMSDRLRRVARDADEQWSDLMRQCERFISSAGGGWPQLPRS